MFTSVKPHMFWGLLTQSTYSNMDFGKKMFSACQMPAHWWLDLGPSMWVATIQGKWLHWFSWHQSRTQIYGTFFMGRRHTNCSNSNVYVLSMGTTCLLREVYMSRQKCSRMAKQVWLIQSTLEGLQHQPAMRKWKMPDPWFSKAEE